MSYVSMGETPDALFARRLIELRQAKTEEAAGTRPPTPLSKIDGWCWDYPGFKDCHAIAFRAAQADCEVQGKRDDGSCIVPLADHYAINACPCERESSLLSGMTGGSMLLVAAGGVALWVLLGGKKKS